MAINNRIGNFVGAGGIKRYNPMTSGMVLWLDAAKNITYDGNNRVSSWVSLVGSISATQSIDANKPIYTANILNNKPVIRFTSSSNHTLSMPDIILGTNYSAYIVEKKISGNNVFLGNSGSNYIGDLGTFVLTTGGKQASFYRDEVLNYLYFSFIKNGGTIIHFQNKQKCYTNSNTVLSSTSLTLSGGISALSGFRVNGDIAEIILYNRAVSDSEHNTICNYFQNKYNLQTTVPIPNNNVITFVGDSITRGTTLSEIPYYPNKVISLLNGTFGSIMQARGGYALTDMLLYVNNIIYNRDISRTNDIVIVWLGTNDLLNNRTDIQCYNDYVNFCTQIKNAGYKVIAATILPRNTSTTPANFETYRLSVNSQIRANYLTFANDIADLASDSIMGQKGNETNTTYYQSDQTHTTITGAEYLATNWFYPAINRIKI